MPGPSNWTTAFTHPDPMDPNDRIRQNTQSKGIEFPYDRPTSYGASSHAGMDGDERQDGADDGPPLPRQPRPDQPLSVWDRVSDALQRESAIGTGYESEVEIGYGQPRGRMGEDGLDAIDLEMDALQRDFRDSYEGAKPATDVMSPKDLFALLSELDPEFSSETFAPEDEDEMRGIYSAWADQMSGLEG